MDSLINLLIQQSTNEGDKIIIQQPVYSPFANVVNDNNRELVVNSLKKDENGRYVMDYEDLESKIDKNVKLFILCNPHNPVGRVWEREELVRSGKIYLKNNITMYF
ncbi:aminotransferase class I/II-fold pyridoxal phosphate-dependent enzyme [Tepidibacter aestuarii]|uniref:aminotransferase class I/II-fold pyridoxal phosphate-dependent enzyme n=1 Tax=Tepidibacter aestuarii TaxID=2925782 RepID=UPI0020BFA4D6|nr:aminotransferase class I/II-fold pyridoxal phosphate-dependent enzyme [Tepidibacter aestuarii]CAH2214596.1 protein of unknown function [Tepidibacter aestuarii]